MMKKLLSALLLVSLLFSLSSCGETAPKDETPPVISAKEQNLHVTPASKTVDLAEKIGFTAKDDVDGDITANLSVDTSSVDFDTPGKYTVTATVSDAAGNSASQEVTVFVTLSPADFAKYCDLNLKDILRNSDSDIIKPILFHFDRQEKVFYWDVYDLFLTENLPKILSADDAAAVKDYIVDGYGNTVTNAIMDQFDQFYVEEPLIIRIYDDAKASNLLFQVEKGKLTVDNYGLDWSKKKFEKTLVYEDDNVSITFLEVTSNAVVFEVDNKTDRNLTIQADSIAINGASTDDIIMSDDVAPQSIGKISAAISQSNILGAREVNAISGQLRIIDFKDRDFKTYDALFDIRLNKKPGYYEYDFDNLLYTDEKIDIYFWDIDKEAVYFVVRNKTDINITIQADSISINRRSTSDIILSDDVAPHSVGIIDADCEIDYEGDVQTVGGQLRIIDFGNHWRTYDATFVNVEVGLGNAA